MTEQERLERYEQRKREHHTRQKRVIAIHTKSLEVDQAKLTMLQAEIDYVKLRMENTRAIIDQLVRNL